MDGMSVGYKLYREVRDFAPPDLTSGELVVAWTIADDANDRTRRSWIPLPLLCARARLKPSSVRAALAKLSERGYEFRVVHGYGKDGRPMFAVRGHTVDYVVPDMLKGATAPAPKPVDNSPNGATALAPNGRFPHEIGASAVTEGASAVAPKSEIGASRLAPLSSQTLIPSLNHSTTVSNGSVSSRLDAEVIHRQSRGHP